MTDADSPPKGVRIFKPRNRLKEKVGEGPAALPNNVEQKFTSEIKNSLSEYFLSLRDEVRQLHVISEPDAEKRDIDTSAKDIYAIAHRIRGEAGTFGYAAVGRIAKSLCDFLETIDHHTPATHSVILLHVDSMGVVLTRGKEATEAEIAHLEGQLAAVSRHVVKPK